MKRRLALIVVLAAAPVLAGELIKTPGSESRTVTWQPVGGPADVAPAPDNNESKNVQGLTVHEWGTFTSVAGPDGKAIEWLPAGGANDLPCFVNLAGSGPKGLPLTAQGGRANRALVRMETPVLYFYSPREQSVSVKVSFPRGLITEWYPSADLGTADGQTGIYKALESFPNVTSTIQWRDVRILPGATETYPIDETQSHYYAARRTGAMPLQVGKQFEKFLFYRGIGSFTPPLSARATADGRIEIANLGTHVISSVVLFENRGGRIGYRIYNDLSGKPITLDMPDLGMKFSSLQQDLESMLRHQGMYAPEARAMVDTWKDSWFEEGARLFYIVPSKSVDAILPLEITPEPIGVARAFVGRMEVLTPATLQQVQTAAGRSDRGALETFGRFLEPILHDFLHDYRADGQITSIRADYVAAVTACSKKNW